MPDEKTSLPVQAVDRFYRVSFYDERGFRRWSERVVEFTTLLHDIVPDFADARPVVFAQLSPLLHSSPRAYVSAGARGLAANIAGGAKVDSTPLTAAALPPGLTMLFGDAIDAAEYEERYRRGALPLPDGQ
jgi:hypothetical protein